MLNRRRAKVVANLFQNALARVAVIAHDPHFDEFVGGQAAVYFTGDCWRQAAAADQHGGFQGVGAGFERSALDRRE